jgi:hypothetical protein
MRPGAEIELSKFSKLDSKLYIDNMLNNSWLETIEILKYPNLIG